MYMKIIYRPSDNVNQKELHIRPLHLMAKSVKARPDPTVFSVAALPPDRLLGWLACEDEAQCRRSPLRALLIEKRAGVK
jgi:hypothetical protein